MCGIVAAFSVEGDVTPYLLRGLGRLDYRGYDSAGIAVLKNEGGIERVRKVGAVSALKNEVESRGFQGHLGIGHTRWATHGKVTERNAHPMMSGDVLALVHNGIVENYKELRSRLQEEGYVFDSETDTEAVAHLVASKLKETSDYHQAVLEAAKELRGNFAIAIVFRDDPLHLHAVKKGCPLIATMGPKGVHLASDLRAFTGISNEVVYLQEGDVVEFGEDGIVAIDNILGHDLDRPVETVDMDEEDSDLGPNDSFMQKEIREQPKVVDRLVRKALAGGGFDASRFLLDVSTPNDVEVSEEVFKDVKSVRILACGTSHYAGLIGKYWLEGMAGVRCDVEIASEFSYRPMRGEDGTLSIFISQSGETFDTKQAARRVRELEEGPRLLICNTRKSAIERDCRYLIHTNAGTEVGVASTKAFTTQLVALHLLTIAIAKAKGLLSPMEEKARMEELESLKKGLEAALSLEGEIEKWAKDLKDSPNALFLGRGAHYPVAMEGALKLKEISYIHAEGYPAGELKHGPLALIDEKMPVIVIAPSDDLFDKVKSNMKEITSRGGKLYVISDKDADLQDDDEDMKLIRLPVKAGLLSPVINAVLVQLIAYHVALLRGHDVDKPRNLAKAVTVE